MGGMGLICKTWVAGGLPAVILNLVRDDLRMMAPNPVAARESAMKEFAECFGIIMRLSRKWCLLFWTDGWLFLKDWIPGPCPGWHSFEVRCVLFRGNLSTIPPSNICTNLRELPFHLQISCWSCRSCHPRSISFHNHHNTISRRFLSKQKDWQIRHS